MSFVDTHASVMSSVNTHASAAAIINKECWDAILQHLAVSPGQQANGIAVASRVMNVRWRKYHLRIMREMVSAGKQSPFGHHLMLCDLEDIL